MPTAVARDSTRQLGPERCSICKSCLGSQRVESLATDPILCYVRTSVLMYGSDWPMISCTRPLDPLPFPVKRVSTHRLEL